MIGAGLAGLSAATRLAAAGRDVHVLEAAGARRGPADDRPGRRLPRRPRLPGPQHRLPAGGRPRPARPRAGLVPHRRPACGSTAARTASSTPAAGRRRRRHRRPRRSAPCRRRRRSPPSPCGRATCPSTGCGRPERTAEEALQQAGPRRPRRWSASCARSSPGCCSRTGSRPPATTSTCSGAASSAAASACRPRGMQSVGQQLADRLPAGRVHLGAAVTGVEGGVVQHRLRRAPADAVVVATDPDAAAGLLPVGDRLGTAAGHHPPARAARLALGRRAAGARPAGRAAGQQRRAHRRPAPLQPRRAGAGRQLDARAHPRGRRPRGDRPGARRRHRDLAHLTSVTVPAAQPAALPPLELRRPVDLGDGMFVCGDHRDTPSIQGAMASGARTARAVLRRAAPVRPDHRSRLMPAAAPTIVATSMGFASRGRGPYDWRPGPVFDLMVELAGAPGPARGSATWARPPATTRSRPPVSTAPSPAVACRSAT